MTKNKTFLLIFILFGATASAQTLFSSRLEGRVYSKDGDVAATHVLNMTTIRATITDENGFFSIPAKLNDTIVFSAVQYKRKEIVVSSDMLDSKMLSIPLEEALTELDEVVVMPYNLTGNIFRDTERMDVEPVITASTLGLPNAYARVPTMAERQLFEATSGSGLLPLNPILNGISGRTKMLKRRVARNNLYARTQRVREMYADSLFRVEFKIPEQKISDFMYFCEVDSVFQTTVDTHDRLKIWDYMRERSIVYLKNNDLQENSKE